MIFNESGEPFLAAEGIGKTSPGSEANRRRTLVVMRKFTHGKYRWRTHLRMLLPWKLISLSPKGKNDCGNHEWSKCTDTHDGCYHCDVGRRETEFPLRTDATEHLPEA